MTTTDLHRASDGVESDASDADMPLRILHVVAPGTVGGLERIVQMLASGHRERGHAVSVAATLDHDAVDHPFLGPFRAAGVDVHPLLVPPRAYVAESRMLSRLFRELRPEVVHTHGYRADVLARAVARRLGLPTVTTVHGVTGGGWRNRLYERLQLASHRRKGAVVAVSRPLERELLNRGVPASQLCLIRNAWRSLSPPLDRATARKILGIGADEVIVAYVGRLSLEKGPDVFLDAVAAEGSGAFTVSLIGAGRERRALEERARRLDIAASIHWHGEVPDAGRLFSAFDVFVLSSRTEGTPVVLFEAMAAEVPVVATRVGGVPDVIGEAGLLVRAEDPPALAEAVRSVLGDQAGARRRAAAARERLVRRFGVEPWLSAYEALYRRLVVPRRVREGC